MGVAELIRLKDLMDESRLPLWLKKELENNREDILKRLRKGESVTLIGDGEEITIYDPDRTGRAA